jgi:hypothetical protein
MRLATSEDLIRRQGLTTSGGLKALLDRGVRPAVGFAHPTDVLKDPHLTHDQKREILCSWASDASAVRDEPALRWLLGTVEPVHIDEVLEALRRLDRLSGASSRIIGEGRELGLVRGAPARQPTMDAGVRRTSSHP